MKITKQVQVTIQIEGDRCSIECKHFFQKRCGLFDKNLKLELVPNGEFVKHTFKRYKKCIEIFGCNDKTLN